METKTGNTWVPFCIHCNHVRKGDKDKCHVCSHPLETICLGCGASPDQGEHECKVMTIPANPLAVQNSQLSTEVELCHKNLKMFRDSLANTAKQRDAAKEIAESANLQIGALREVIKVLHAEWDNHHRPGQCLGDPSGSGPACAGCLLLKRMESHITNETRKWRVDAKGNASLERGPDELELGLQISDLQKAWKLVEPWMGVESRSDPVAERDILAAKLAMRKAFHSTNEQCVKHQWCTKQPYHDGLCVDTEGVARHFPNH